MIKNLLLLLGGAVVVYAGYAFVTKKNELNETSDIITNPIVNASLQTQPQQKFPYENIVSPRVDNADQPWYGGTRAFMGAINSDVMDDGHKSADIMTYDTTGFWTDLESKFTIH